jgi:anti-sigma regulatory factor (Ser/Thr protein kinase)
MANVGLSTHRHIVELYRDESQLACHVARFLSPGLGAGYPTMIMATPSLRAQFESAFDELDTDLDRPRATGSLIELDADELLDAISVRDHVDAEAFDRVIGKIARSFPAGLPIPGFGQMVGLLWERGDIQGALELEGMWNRLSLEVRVHAYCGFHAESVPESESVRLLADLHDHVVLLSSVEPLQLAAQSSSPRMARQFAVEALEEWDLTRLRDQVEVIVSELVTNAVLHARTTLTLSMTRREDLVRVAVRDSSRVRPAEPSSQDYRANGRGLRIVKSLATDYGTFVAPDGKTVWAHLAT